MDKWDKVAIKIFDINMFFIQTFGFIQTLKQDQNCI